MRALPVALALLFSTPALAGNFAGPAHGSVKLESTVEVPLYASPDKEDPRYCVEVKSGEEPLLLLIGTGDDTFYLSEGAAGRIKAKISGEEGDPVRTAKLGDLALGAATLSGAKAVIKDPGVPGVDGIIGIGAFEDASWAILPTQGVLRVVPLEKGGELAASLGATAIPYTSSPYEKVHLNKGPKTELPGIPYIVPAKFSGVELPSIVALEGDSLVLREGDWYKIRGLELPPAVSLPEAPSHPVGDLTLEWRPVEVAGRTTEQAVLRMGLGPAQAFVPARAQVGTNALAGVDLVIDTQAHTLAMKPGAGVKLADYAPVKEAYLRAKLDKGDTDDAKKEARKKGIGALATNLEAQGRYDEAIELRKESTQLEGEKCGTWQSLGAAYLKAGHPADALEPLKKAWDLYEPWSKLPLEERTRLQKDYDAAKEKKEAWEGTVPQANACFTAAGQLAFAKIATGDTGSVASLYPALLDLDSGLPIAAGTAALLAGDTEAAEAAYRQAVKLTQGTDDSVARAGLWFALQRRDLSLAREQLERTDFAYGKVADPELVRLYAEAIRAKQGPAESVKALQAEAATQPWNVTLQVQLAREQQAAGDQAGATASLATARKILEFWSPVIPDSLEVNAVWVDLLLLEGKVDEARGHAERATKVAPGSGLAWLALAKVEAAAGNAAKADEYRTRAGIAWVKNPAYALMLQK